MNQAQSALHDRAIELAETHKRIEFPMIEVLQKIDEEKGYKHFGCASLYNYATEILGLSESMSYAYIAVARKAAKISELQETLYVQGLSVAKAVRFNRILTKENAAELISFAKSHSARQIDQEVARRDPRAVQKKRARPVSQTQTEVHWVLDNEVLALMKRAQDLRGVNDEDVILKAALKAYLDQIDPVRKAERANRRREQKNLQRVNPKAESPAKRPKVSVRLKRIPLTAEQKYQVNSRDQGRCSFILPSEQRCENERWIHAHHIVPVSQGGANDPANLITLCAAHHDLVHQLCLPIEQTTGQIPYN